MNKQLNFRNECLVLYQLVMKYFICINLLKKLANLKKFEKHVLFKKTKKCNLKAILAM
jgi:hypothetical protein